MMFIFFIVSYLFCGCKGTKIIRNQKYHDCGILQKSHLRIQLFNHLNIETERTEAVVAADHRTQGIFHPAIIKVPFTSG